MAQINQSYLDDYTKHVKSTSTRQSRKFRDIDLDFGRNPVTNDVNIVVDAIGIKRCVKNLIQTNHYERPFHPELGSDIRAMLFEPMTPLTALNLQRKVAEVLNNFEPRINLQQVLASPNIDANSYNLRIMFYVVGVAGDVTVETMLERLR